ncbi:gamma carbonic anhydrase family protein [Legionella taurinensis]|uniref:Gamma carbonic anhydrase family protein n=1 Tax=Legionella taurinensis TaxID=70611 RepID=A0A3A5L5K6_9GAMM|nr:gamma carbonic anhydrase family protein [Legionella taurinensis]MDX1838606.1 gamma carbonic anhydrase family protein [Legionella taurinensis]PUT39044.1 gamma carbonic anhydrase family protein [Legionella taurinensis]PUT41131.1 gamma carbonic anhydrase family protein [Legionella taurinensis]PUT43506.1 gamma carbonic anhydrase family protein [Legionella taurinensis]PUT46523.1 gamma carbonic anhydrase family protein [Legionella taurinensis]
MNPAVRPYLDHVPVLGQDVYIDPTAAVIGRVQLGNHVSVWPMAVIRGDVNAITVGDDCNIQDAAILHVTHDGPFTPGGQPLVLGKGITVGHQAVLHACQIDDYCLIGMGVLILDGAYIEHHVLIGAGSVVPPGKRLESGFLYLGNPVKAIRPLSEEELRHLDYSAAHYVRLKNNYLTP